MQFILVVFFVICLICLSYYNRYLPEIREYGDFKPDSNKKMSKQGSFKVSRINLENLNATGEPNKQVQGTIILNPLYNFCQGNQATWEQQRKEFDRIVENIYEPKSKEKAKLQTCVQELFQYMKNSSDAAKNQQLNNLGCVLNLLGTQLASKSIGTKSDKDDISLIKSKEQIDGSVKDFEKELEELRNRNNMYQQEISEVAHIKDKLKAMAERCTSANEAGLSKKSSVEIINSRSSIEGEKASLKHDLEELMIKKSSPESVIDQMNIYLETIQIEFDKVYSQVQELKVREKEFEMKKREDPENKSFIEKINMFNQQRKEKSLVLERKLSKLSHDSNDLAGSEANSPMMLSLGDDDINNNMRRENDELKKAMRLLKQKVEELDQENKQINEALVKKNNERENMISKGAVNAASSRKSSGKTEGQQSGTEDPENVKELKEKQRKLEVTIEDLQKKIELEKVAKNQIIELKKELELENYQLRTEKAKSQNSNQPSQSQSGTPTVENVIKLEEKVGDGPLSGERDELKLLLKEKEGFKAQVRHLTNAVNKLKHRSISLQEPLVESFEILGVIASIEREIFKLKYENEAYQAEGEQGSQPIEGSNSEGKGIQTTSQIAGLNVETLSKLLSAFDKVKPALNSYFIKLQESTSMSGSIRKKQSSISLEKRSLQLFNLEKMDESQRFIPDQEAQESRSPGIAVDAVSEDGREVILSEIAENVTERDHSENHGTMEHFQLTRGTLETLYKCLDGYLKQAQQISNQGQEELIEVGKSEELQSFLAYVKDSGVGEMLYILQRNRGLHEENVQLKRNLKSMQRGEGSVIYNKDSDDNDNLSIGSKGSKVQSISYSKEEQNYGEDEQFSKSIVISDIDSGNQDTLDSPFMRKPTRNAQDADAPKTSAKRSKSLEEALEAETKAKEDLCKIILEKSVEIEQLAMENERIMKENEELQGKLKELEKTYQNIMKECEATLIVCDELQETNSILRKTSEHADEEIKGLINSNKHIQELLSKAQNDLDAAKLEYQDLSDKYNQSQENNKQENVAQEAEKQTNQSQNELQELITTLQKEQEELTEECKVLLLKYNDLQEENKQLAESNKNFVQEVQSHLENSEKAQMLIKNLEKEKEELASDCKELLAKYNKLQETHSQLNETHSSLDKEAQSHIENNNHAQEQILALQKEKESLMIEAEALSNKHNQLQEEHAKLRQAHETSMKDIELHLEKNKETEDLVAKLEKEKEALETDCKNLLEKHSKLEEDHKQLNNTHSNSKEEIQRHLDEHKGAQELIAQLQKEKEDLILENQNLNTKYKQLNGDNEQLNKAKEEILQTNKEIQDSIAKLEKENEILSKDYKEWRERYAQLEETHKLMSNSSTSSSEEIQRQLDKNRQAQEQILKLQKENEAVRSDMESLVLKHNQLQGVHDQLSNSYKTMNDEASRHLENYKRAEEQITKLESEKENIHMSHSELYDKFNRLQEMHEQLSKANQASGEEVKQHADSNKEAQDLIAKLQQEQEMMRKEAKILAEKHTELQERHMNLTKTQENSHIEIQQHLENLKLAQGSISKLQKENGDLSRNHEISQADYNKLQEEHKKLSGSHDNLQVGYNNLQQVIEKLKKEKEATLQDYNNLTSNHTALQESHRELSQATQNHLKTHQTLQDQIVKLHSENEELTRSLETEKMRKSTPKSAKGRHFPTLNPIDEVEQNDYPHDQTNIVLGTPVNKKVINLLDQLNSQIKTELTTRSRLVTYDDSDGSVNIMAPKQKVPGERPKTLPKISYDILNWIADEALLVKKLCSLCDKEVRRDTQGEIKTVILELAQLNDGLKDYYNSCMEKNVDNPLRHFDFLQDLLIKCFEKQRTLQPIQTKIVSHIEGIVNARKTVK